MNRSSSLVPFLVVLILQHYRRLKCLGLSHWKSLLHPNLTVFRGADGYGQTARLI
jgi:hypothetical protein